MLLTDTLGERAQSWVEKMRAQGAPPSPFPIDELLAALHRTGKLRAPTELLEAVECARSVAGRLGALTPLEAEFLAIATDKHAGRYDYQSYLAMPVLEQALQAPADDVQLIADEVLALVRALLADLLLFEWETCHGREPRLPVLVGARSRLEQRMRRIVGALGAFEQPTAGGARTVEAAAARARTDVDAAPEALRSALRYSVLPMSRVHDEYLFIRVLQCFELLFLVLVSAVEGARQAAVGGALARGASGLAVANRAFAAAPALFKVLTTMPPEHFHAFRMDTDGSSAIGSRRVKLLEVLCHRASPQEIASKSFDGVPEVCAAWARGLRTLEDVLVAPGESFDPPERTAGAALAEQLRRLEDLYRAWRRTHFAIARRWIADAAGTGGTDGVRYLAARMDRPLFPYLARDGAFPQ